MLKKTTFEENLIDDGELYDEYKHYWAMLVDKAYQGLAEQLRAIHPKKKPKNGSLSSDDKRRNKQISSDRVLAEIFLEDWNLSGAS